MVFKKGESGSEEYKFKPGESGNPNGRPVGRKSFKTIIQEIAEQEINYKDLKNNKISIKAGEALIISLFAKAIYKKDSQSAKILMEHAEAKKLEHSGSIDTTHKISDEDRTLLERMGIKVDD
jgi:uncharacterized protein (UPF0371 family)